MKHWMVASGIWLGMTAVAATQAAQGEPYDPLEVAAAALQPAAAPVALRRVESAPLAAGPDNTCDPNGLCLRVTVSRDLDPAACGEEVAMDVTAGDQVNFCYTVSNNSDTAFEYQTASDNVGRAERQLFLAFKHRIEPHSTYRFNRIETMRETMRATTTWTAAAAVPEYSYDDTTPFEWLDIVGAGADLDIGDSAQTSVEMPFPVNFYGVPSRYLTVSSGAIAFGSMHSPYLPWSWPLPIACIINYAGVCPMIAPFGQGFADSYGGGVYVRTLGAEPNRRFVVEWYDLPFLSLADGQIRPTAGGVTYELVFEEGSDEILFQYLDTSFDEPAHPDYDDGALAVIGVNFGGWPNEARVATAYSQTTPSLHDGLAIRWTPSAVASSRTTARATVNVWTPSAVVSAESIVATVPSQGATTHPLVLSNFTFAPGFEGALRWSFGLPDSGAHLPSSPRSSQSHDVAATELPSSATLQFLRARREENARLAASGSPLRYPQPQPRSAAAEERASTLGAEGIPAYVAIETLKATTDELTVAQLGRWNFATPQTVDAVSDTVTSQSWLGGQYQLDFMGDDYTTVYAMNGPDLMAYNTSSGTGVATTRFDLPDQININHIRSFNYLASEGVFYSLLCHGGSGCRVYKLDPRTGSVQEGPRQGGIQGMTVVCQALAATGELYGVNLVPGGQLLAIDRVTGLARVVGDMHVLNDTRTLNGWSMDFDDSTGQLYLTALDSQNLTSVLHTVDTVTGLTQEIGRYRWVAGEGADMRAIEGLAIARNAPFAPCTDLAATPWLSVEPSSGLLTGGAVDIDVRLDANGLADGIYTANLCLNTNDPDRRHILIPTTLVVGDAGAEAIFRNGFD